MTQTKKILAFLITVCLSMAGFAQQTDSTEVEKDSVNIALLESYNNRLLEIEKQRLDDSIKKSELEQQISILKTTDNLKKEELQAQLDAIKLKEDTRLLEKRQRIDSLKNITNGYPVNGFFNDTLFFLYSKLGGFSPKDRADAITKRVDNLGSEINFNENSLIIETAEATHDIVFGQSIIMSITETDALWNNTTKEALAQEYKEIITTAVIHYKEETNFFSLAKKIGLAILVLVIIIGLVKYISKLFRYTAIKIQLQKDKKIKGINIRNYTLFDAERQINVLLLANKVAKWLFILLVIYISLPILFGIFPWTEHFAATLFGYILNPLKNILLSFWNYLPDLVTIIVIIFVFRYVLKGIRFLKDEVAEGNLVLTGFYRDWAEPTYQIVRILLIAFTLVVIWPYLPGSDSPVFQGVSVFLGFLFTFGSAGSLSNVIAGLVLTYMRLFSLGDFVKIGDISGNVIEKSALVTRVRTPRNEIISIPNSTVMNSHTVNYSTAALEKGLIVHTTVTFGYEIPWKVVYKGLIEAALRTDLVLKEPKPFVFQTGLEDFYVAYEINAFVRDANMQGLIYSELRKNIQDVFNELGIELMSPHYQAERDGSTSTIPPEYSKEKS